MDRLVDHQVKSLARNRVIVGKCQGRVVTLYANRLVKVKKDQGIVA